MHIVQSCTLKDFAIKPQSKRIIYYNDTTQVFMSTFLDGSASHLILPHVPFTDVKSFACENNDFLVTDGKAVFQQDSLSFNEFIVGCDLSHIEEFGFGNLVIFGSYTQPHPVPGHPQQLSVLFGSQQALVQWTPPALAIGAKCYEIQGFCESEFSQGARPLVRALSGDYPGTSDMKGDVYVWLLNGMDVSENYHIPNIAGAGALAFEWLGHFLYWAGKTYVVIALTLDLSDGLLYWLVQDSQCIHLYTAVLRGQSTGDPTITEFAAWSTSDISQNALMYYSGRLFWINGFRIITAQEIGQRTSVSVLEPAKFHQFTIIQTSLKPLPGNFSFTPKVIPDFIPESSFMIEGNASSFQILWNAPPAVDWGVIFYSVEFSAPSKFLASEQQSLPVFSVEGLEPYALFNLSVTPYTYWGKGPKTSLSLRAPEAVPSAPENPRIFVLPSEKYHNKNEVVVEFTWNKPKHENGVLTRFEIFYQISKESDTNKTFEDWIVVTVTPSVMSFQLQGMSPGYTVAFQVRVFTSKGPGPFSDIVKSKTSGIYYLKPEQITISDPRYSQGYPSAISELKLKSNKIFRDALVFDITMITVDWLSRHLYFVLKGLHNGMQIFDLDLENKVKYPRKLKICNRNSTIISFSVYPCLSRLYWTEVSNFGSQMFYYSIINQTLHQILQPTAINHPTGRSQCSCNVTELELSGAMTIDTSDLKKPQIYFVKGQEIWAMDLEGCQCWQVTMMPALLGKTLVSLTVDGEFLYWIATAKDSTQIYQVKKSNGVILSQRCSRRSGFDGHRDCPLPWSPLISMCIHGLGCDRPP
ncbi:hypothetical protein CB1_000895002 [Camelus ferus]|nr:hypothetical protein CB1_000895002 [Camelus ferus]